MYTYNIITGRMRPTTSAPLDSRALLTASLIRTLDNELSRNKRRPIPR